MIKDNFKNIYIMTTMNCNMHCDHCFVPKINNELSEQDLEKICDFINTHTKDDFINIVFHGGEPTMIGHKKFRHILEFLSKKINKDIKYQFNIQTNLIVINKELIAIYKEFFSIIGISYDINIRHVKNGNFEEIFFKNLQILKDNHIKINCIITLTKEVLKIKPIKFYSLIKNNFNNIHIEKLTYDGEAIENWNSIGVTNLEYSNYMIELFKIYSKDIISKEDIHISPFDSICRGVITKSNYSCKGMCNNFYSFGPNSFVGTCTALTSSFNENIKIKNIKKENYQFVENLQNIDKSPCTTCDHIYLCKEGCPSGVNKVLDGSNECRGASTLLSFITTRLKSSKTLNNHFKNLKISIEEF